MKIGLGDVPPLFLAAMRYIISAPIFILWAPGTLALAGGRRWRRVMVSGVLVNAGTYGFLFWGMRTVPSGLSGLINLSIIPVALFVLAVATGEMRPNRRHGAAILLGFAGLLSLFWTRVSAAGAAEVLGLAAIVVGSLSYCFGVVISRPLLNEADPREVAGAQAIIGAIVLLIGSLLLEPVDGASIHHFATPAALGSLAFLVLGGTVVAYTIYLRLLSAWGTARSGLYAFVSPVIALWVGAVMFAEPVTTMELIGAGLLLLAAGIALAPTRARSSKAIGRGGGPIG